MNENHYPFQFENCLVKLRLICVVKAVDRFQSFSNTIGRRSINELCLASLLCDHASALSE